MKSLIFDTGPLISLTLNNLLWTLEPLKKEFNGEFYIGKITKKEIIDKPLATKQFKFEALQVLQMINNGVLKVIDDEKIRKKAIDLLDIANVCFKARGNPIQICHLGEMESVAAALIFGTNAVVIDERTTRVLIESPERLANLLERKLHTPVAIDHGKLNEFSNEVRKIQVLRSVELMTIAYERGILDRFAAKIPNPQKELLDGVLWGLKINGCAISGKEIEEILKIEVK